MRMGASASVGHMNYWHDIRVDGKYSKNVDKELIKDDVILCDKLKGRSIEEYTNEWMKPHIDAYNAKQTRKDRMITSDYSTYHKLNGYGELAYECVVQFGEHDSLGGLYYELSKRSDEVSQSKKEILHDYMLTTYSRILQEFEERYPHLQVLYATVHFDEPNGTPHMHMCYQPVSNENKKGLETRVSIGGALTKDGIERVKTRKEAIENGGYQIAKMYNQFRKEIIMPTVEQQTNRIMGLNVEWKEEYTHGHVDSFISREEHGEYVNPHIQLNNVRQALSELGYSLDRDGCLTEEVTIVD